MAFKSIGSWVLVSSSSTYFTQACVHKAKNHIINHCLKKNNNINSCVSTMKNTLVGVSLFGNCINLEYTTQSPKWKHSGYFLKNLISKQLNLLLALESCSFNWSYVFQCPMYKNGFSITFCQTIQSSLIDSSLFTNLSPLVTHHLFIIPMPPNQPL